MNKARAIEALNPGVGFSYNEEEGIVAWHSDKPKPTDLQINEKLTELQNAEPMRLLREERNWKLQETDWMSGSDVTMSDAWKKYRQALRDLPATSSPSLDKNGNLTGVNWPTKPE